MVIWLWLYVYLIFGILYLIFYPQDMKAAALTDIGLVRKTNEDAYWYDANRGIFVVADGLGGQQGGEVAAALAVKCVCTILSDAVDDELADAELVDALHRSFRTASEEIHRTANQLRELKGMACSLIAAIVQDGYCNAAHAGDCRAYLFYNNELSQMTLDDTPVATLVKSGFLLKEKAKSHSMKNVLVKSVGGKPEIDANITRFPVKPGERLMFCTDGLWGTVEEQTIREILHDQTDLSLSCRAMVRAARENGGQDNITVVVAEME